MPEHLHYDDDAIVNVETHHEHSDVNVRALITFFVIFVVFGLVTHFVLLGMFKAMARYERNRPTPRMTSVVRPEDAAVPTEPRLQPFPTKMTPTDTMPPYSDTPVTDMVRMHANEDQVLHHYGWVDKNKGVVHIPIEEAKKRALERGIFASPAAPITTTAQNGVRP